MLSFEEHSNHLQFPTLPIDGSIAYYLSRSTLVSMASNPDHLSEDTTSSLGDSTYEVLSESIFFNSEDEDHEDNADWVAPNDQVSSDDLASLADTDESKQTQDLDLSNSHVVCGDRPVLEYADSETDDCVGDSSTITTKGHDHFASQSIEFQEPQPYPGAEQVDVIHTVHKLSPEEAEEAIITNNLGFSNKGSGQLVATIRQTMTRQGLVLDRPFRIVFVGDASAQNEIIEKVGAALAVPSSWGPAAHAAHRKSSRFNIVPVSSFGDPASTEVELIDSSGLEIVVDHCTFADFTVDGNITLTLNESIRCQSTRGGHGFKVQSDSDWHLPDIAILYRSKADDLLASRTGHLAHSFMDKLKVPSIVISEEPLWKTPNVPAMLASKGPHLCLEARGVNVSENRVLRRLPVDLSSFKNIDSGQMNRNLACLTGLHSGKDHVQAMEREHRTAIFANLSPSKDLEKATTTTPWLVQSTSRLRELMRQNVRAIALIGALFIYAMVYIFTPMEYLKSVQSLESRQTATLPTATSIVSVPSAIPSSTLDALSQATSNSLVPSPVFRDSEASSLNTVSVRDNNMDLARLLRNTSLVALNESDQFKVQVVGDCHIVLRPPQSSTRRKNRPNLSVRVLRNEVIIEHEVSKLFESVYAVKLKREDAYGSLNVSVWAKSKPTLNETFIVDFGTPWLKTHGWKKVVEVMSTQIKDEYDTRLGKVSLMFGRVGGAVQGLIRPAISKVAANPGAPTRTEKTPLQCVSGTKTRAILRIKALSHLVSRQATIHSKQLIKESVRLSKKSLLLSERIREDLGTQTRDLSALGARSIKTLCNAATGVDPAKLWVELSKLPPVHYKQSLRPVQKSALRIWKRLSGAKAKMLASPHSSHKARKSRFNRKRNR